VEAAGIHRSPENRHPACARGIVAAMATTWWWSTWPAVRYALAAALELVLPSSCAACHGVATGPLCGPCRAGVRSASGCAGPAGPRPPPAAMPRCWAGACFDGAVRLAVTAYKDEGRRDLRDELARLLGAALTRAVADPAVRHRMTLGEQVLVVPVPTARASRRRRGDDPVAALARAATDAVGALPQELDVPQARRRIARGGLSSPQLVVATALVHTRRVADQAQLDRMARARNQAGAMAVGAAWRGVVQGAACVVVDDVVTTGATLAEAARALHAAGARDVLAATCATTPRRAPDPPLWPPRPQTSVSA
jgi:predicted amidophosphoribosyltransferase